MHVNWHIVDAIYMHLHVTALPWYNICIVLQNYLLLFLTIVIRHQTEIHANRHIMFMRYISIWSSYL